MTDPNIHDPLSIALQVHAEGQLNEAKALYEAILQNKPNEAYAQHGLGLIYAALGDFKHAIHYFSEAISVSPKVPEFHNNMGNAYKMVGQLVASKRHFSEALRLKPRYPEAHNNLGALYYKEGDYEASAHHFNKAIAIYPEYVDAHYNLGICYTQLNQIKDALSHFQHAVDLMPTHRGALHNLGVALVTLGDLKGAQNHLETLVELEPNNLQGLFHLGIVYGSLNLEDKAVVLYSKILEAHPDHAYAHHNLATIYLNQRKQDLALLHYEKTYALMPDNETAKHMIDALKGHLPKEGAPLGYVKALFDQYSYSYDEHMQKTLKYHVPALIREQLTPFTLKASSPWVGLDLGCGTGLCSPLLQDIVGKLYGVDISFNMIQQAKIKGGYLKLFVDDIVTFMENTELRFDLVVAADVFVYFGKLDPVFKAVKKVLNRGGYFSFSVENRACEALAQTDLATKQDSSAHEFLDYSLQLSGRYSHHPRYIEQLAQEHHLSIESKSGCILREQDNEPIYGTVYVLSYPNP